MNLLKISEIVKYYKEQFQSIDGEEIYKWKAIKQFQEYYALVCVRIE